MCAEGEWVNKRNVRACKNWRVKGRRSGPKQIIQRLRIQTVNKWGGHPHPPGGRGVLFEAKMIWPLYNNLAIKIRNAFLMFWETSILFSIAAAPICNPTNDVWGFPFLSILDDTCYSLIYWWQSFWQVSGDISLWFWFAFLWWLATLSIFSCVY